ncbi:uncharacterized protein MKK02DRAFT_31067 [Dioszegia hungarica]|uniref:Uncharacterized protein n=1 Tax=Dioszegia hungarica TaxID=4972 RepID=A0AA38HG88_9TREE|nr:uncharacterized protein MKK02DRAFT_31067 [Dioszegia hungarica]KAI9638741.1 hypothetical protein MKK02DRAFT_31067 [Dioszegia hungarica]
MSERSTSSPAPLSPTGSLPSAAPIRNALRVQTSFPSLGLEDPSSGEHSPAHSYRESTRQFPVPDYASRDFSFVSPPRNPDATRWRMELVERDDEEGGESGGIRWTLTAEPSALSKTPIPRSEHFLGTGFELGSEEHRACAAAGLAWDWAYPHDTVYWEIEPGVPAVLDQDSAKQALWQFFLTVGDTESAKSNKRVLVRPLARDHHEGQYFRHGPIVIDSLRTLGCITQSVDDEGAATGEPTEHRGIVLGSFYSCATTYCPVPSGVFSHEAQITDPPTVITVPGPIKPLFVMLPPSRSSTGSSGTGPVGETATFTGNDAEAED